MPYNAQDILDSSNPYDMFDNGDTLAEHRKILDAFSAEEKKTLATKIICGCPQDKLKAFGQTIRSLSSLVPEEKETFYSVISAAHQVRTKIMNLLDPLNKQPNNLFLDESLPDLFNKFNKLAQNVLEDHETAIAERLALLTPDEHSGLVTKKVGIMFERHSFSETIGIAFTLKHNVKQLLGKNPESFFMSRDFNVSHWHQFPSLFEGIKGNEEQIGQKLSQVEDKKLKIIERNLHLLTTGIYDQVNPFKLILDAMQTKKSVVIATHPETFFGSSHEKSQTVIKLANDSSESSNLTQKQQIQATL